MDYVPTGWDIQPVAHVLENGRPRTIILFLPHEGMESHVMYHDKYRDHDLTHDCTCDPRMDLIELDPGVSVVSYSHGELKDLPDESDE